MQHAYVNMRLIYVNMHMIMSIFNLYDKLHVNIFILLATIFSEAY